MQRARRTSSRLAARLERHDESQKPQQETVLSNNEAISRPKRATAATRATPQAQDTPSPDPSLPSKLAGSRSDARKRKDRDDELEKMKPLHKEIEKRKRPPNVSASPPPAPDAEAPAQVKRRARASASAADMARSLPPLALPARPNSLHSLPAATLAKLSAHERARRLLHVGATPEALPCRQQQFLDVVQCTTDALQAGAGECVYIYGVPGTGKTATVREAIRTLERRMSTGEVPAFRFVEINGMKLASAMQAYTELWSAVQGGKRLHPRAALSKLAAHFNAGDAQESRVPIVVLMDELDMFVTSRQDVIYNLFHWPNLPHSNLVVIAVANTMDLPERTLQPKVASRLGMTRIPFMPYTDRQLLDIVRARLDIDEQGTRTSNEPATAGCEKVFKVDALLFAAKRVANVSGDARRMLDVCRRVVELAEHRAAVNRQEPAPISILEMREVLDRMARSGRAAHIAALSLHGKLLLASMYACVRKTEVAEVEWGEVLSHHAALCRTHSVARTGTTQEAGIQDYNEDELLRPLATLCALGIVVAVGTGAGSARAGPFARYMVMVPEEEAKLAMQDARLPGL